MYFVQCVRSEKPSLSGVKHLHFRIYVVVSLTLKYIISISQQI